MKQWCEERQITKVFLVTFLQKKLRPTGEVIKILLKQEANLLSSLLLLYIFML